MLIHACTDSVRAFRASGMLDPKSATPAPKAARISTQSRRDPSWLPQVPAILKRIGLSECEFSTTFATVKSLTTKACINAVKEIPMKISCAIDELRALRIHKELPRAAPSIGSTL